MIEGFTGRLRLDFGDWGPNVGRIATLLDTITWRGVTVRAGYMTDGATVPRFLWWLLPPWGDPATIAAVFHDFVCDELKAGRPLPACETREGCDKFFRECLEALGVAHWRAWACWSGVRAYSVYEANFVRP